MLPRYIIFLLFITSLVSGCQQRSGLPDLKERYQYNDTRPFGTYTAYHLLSGIYDDKFININKKPFASFYAGTYVDSASIYISISNKFFVNEDDAKSLVEFVGDGNTAFIASSYIDSTLMEKVLSRQAGNHWMNNIMSREFADTHVQLATPASSKDSFGYYYFPFSNYFSEIDPGMGRAIGYNSNNRPNCAVFFIGKGRLYLHCDPRAFSNYFLLTANNHEYMKQLMQVMSEKPGNIFWDDHYNKINYREDDDGNGNSALGNILQHPPLAMAFWIVLAMLILYIFFNGKRKQRVIPVIKPVANTSVAFTEAIAGLYLAERNNRNIADKMITYLNEHIRTRYFLNSQAADHNFVTTLSKKSGVPRDAVESLFNAVHQTQQTQDITDFELLSLNEQIQEFYKKRI